MIKPTNATVNQNPPTAWKSRRAQPRQPLNVPIVVEHAAGAFNALTINVGPGGMFIEADTVLPYAATVEILVQLPGLHEPSRLPAVVRWSNESGFGVQFLQLGARETHALASLVASANG